MSYWKTKVVPKLKKFFDKGSKKKGASDACKLFDASKESLEKEIGEKTTDLNPKVVEIYRSSPIITKKLLKEPSESAVKENPDAAQNILQELAKTGFPGAQVLCDAGNKYGPALLPGPIVYLFAKTSTFLVEEPLPDPKLETREIATEETTVEQKTKEPEASSEGVVVKPPHPPPTEPLAPVEESSMPGEEKKEAIPILEAKKEESIPVIETKKEEVAPIEVKKEVAPMEAEKEGDPAEVKKEEVTGSKEDKKEDVSAVKEVNKEEVATSSEGMKEEVGALVEDKEEEKSIASVEEKKEKPT